MALTLTTVSKIGASGEIKRIITAWKTAIDAWSTGVDSAVTLASAAAPQATTPRIFSGTGAATGIQMVAIGDLYIKTDGPTVYMAKGLTKSSDWVQLN